MKNFKLFVPAYVLIVAALYHYSYWSKFGVNILEFTSVQDLASMAVFPFVASIAGLLIGNVISIAQSAITSGKTQLIAFVVLMVFFGIWMVFGAGLAFLLAAFLITIILASGRVSVDPISEYLKHDSVRRLAIGWAILIIPAMAFSHGGLRADKILDGIRYSFVTVESKNYRYVGFVGGNYFLYSPSQESLLIASQNSLGMIEQHFYPELSDGETLFEKWRNSDTNLDEVPDDKADSKLDTKPDAIP